MRDISGSRDELVNTAKGMLEPARHFLLGSGMVLGSGVAQVSLAVFVCFFLYRDGQNIVIVAHGGIVTCSIKDVCRDLDHAIRLHRIAG